MVLFTKIYKKIKEKDLKISKCLNTFDVFLFFYHKGLTPLIRGLIYGLFLKKSHWMIFIGKNTKIQHASHLFLSKGCYIGDYSYLNCLSEHGVHLGKGVTIREFGWMQLTSQLENPGDKIIIGDNTYIGPYSKIGAAGPVIIGSYCQFGAGISIVAENHQFSSSEAIINQSVTRKGVVIGDDCWIGNNVIILDGVDIGSGCVIGAGAVVNKSIPENSIAVGVPARVINTRKK